MLDSDWHSDDSTSAECDDLKGHVVTAAFVTSDEVSSKDRYYFRLIEYRNNVSRHVLPVDDPFAMRSISNFPYHDLCGPRRCHMSWQQHSR